MAYRLDLPSNSKIRPVFHISLLRQYKGDLLSQPLPLPTCSKDHHPFLTPLAISDRRTNTRNTDQIDQVLVQWEGTELDKATWEDSSNLEDKVLFEVGRDGMIVNNQQNTNHEIEFLLQRVQKSYHNTQLLKRAREFQRGQHNTPAG